MPMTLLILVEYFTGLPHFSSSIKSLINGVNIYESPVYHIKINFLGSFLSPE